MKPLKYCVMDRTYNVVRSFNTRIEAERFKTANGRLDWAILQSDKYKD